MDDERGVAGQFGGKGQLPARFVVAAAAGAFHVGLARSGVKANPVLAWLTVALFAGFAVGIAVGAEWATWH